jgi:hypothetical protein
LVLDIIVTAVFREIDVSASNVTVRVVLVLLEVHACGTFPLTVQCKTPSTEKIALFAVIVISSPLDSGLFAMKSIVRDSGDFVTSPLATVALIQVTADFALMVLELLF